MTHNTRYLKETLETTLFAMVKRNDYKAEKDKMKCRNNKEAKEPNMNGNSTDWVRISITSRLYE